jgi:hypothetical protein
MSTLGKTGSRRKGASYHRHGGRGSGDGQLGATKSRGSGAGHHAGHDADLQAGKFSSDSRGVTIWEREQALARTSGGTPEPRAMARFKGIDTIATDRPAIRSSFQNCFCTRQQNN